MWITWIWWKFKFYSTRHIYMQSDYCFSLPIYIIIIKTNLLSLRLLLFLCTFKWNMEKLIKIHTQKTQKNGKTFSKMYKRILLFYIKICITSITNQNSHTTLFQFLKGWNFSRKFFFLYERKYSQKNSTYNTVYFITIFNQKNTKNFFIL